MSRSIPTGSFQWMKSINKSAILNVIRLQGPISRAEIAKVTKLTSPTVTNIVAELLESGLVVESDRGVSTGGRKPILLKINGSAFGVIGVYAGARKVEALAADLDGNTSDETHLPVPPRPTAEQFVSIVKEAVRQVAEKIQNKNQPLLGIGVGMHGLVDPVQGVSIYAPNLYLRDIPIGSMLEEEFGVPVEVENDVRALAMGESWFGQGQGIDDFVSVHVGTGVGAGIVFDGRLVHGPSFTAGELGHITIDIHGPLCSCGNYGCLEAFAAAPAMVKRARERLRAGASSSFLDWIGDASDSLTGEAIFEAARQGDAFAIKVLEETGRYLGIGLSNLVNLFNPRKIILSGGVVAAGAFVLGPLKQTVRERALSTPAADVSIVPSTLGEKGRAIGAFTLVMQKLFQPQP
ncbi:MarR family transcriptional regulator [Melghirimyces profundicolus]|uniref:MarR family transcriptional regulator n=1 Tax=Melghirimyces profundicolus TaxID=1242148 RepID=A0A2T6C823_9BACL|nr:ROK family transcriptional regulator [Melghirimyces profundicolus]PTX64443.1 MarR family transcriptional regulator [Melghirimyces profundicolus]